ncbi:helix-turn-helix domain-containing protein [Sphingomonas sp. NPDC079357]|uniref:helix-turn-helix domain-containing protein n=1 Tax=Sphingomonas sp. NPDC079357 TaxID=3364518 RepID=UPI00384F09B4
MSAVSFGDIMRQRRLLGCGTRPTDNARPKSHHEDTRKAKPWRVHGDRNRKRWNVFKAAALRTFDIMRQKHLMALRDARAARRAGETMEVPGAQERLHGDDRAVLSYMLDRYNHMNGELYPAYATIAAQTGLSHGFVKAAMARLRAFGLIDWVRRSKTKEGAEGHAGPQLEQTSNAYFFSWPEQLIGSARETFLNFLTIGLKKLTERQTPASPPRISDPELAAALSRLRAGVEHGPVSVSSASS